MSRERLFDLPETKGSFQLKGIVSGTEKDGFYKEIETKNKKDMKIVNFGVSYDTGKTLYVNMQGIEQDLVYFTKKADKPGEKGDTKKVSWAERFKFNREGYRMIGKNIGVKKKVDETGKVVNDKKILTDYDACVEIKENLEDGQSVFIRGNLDYSSFVTNNGEKRTTTKLVPNQVSLCADCDFEASDYKSQNDFNQVIVFMGIEQEKDSNDKPTDRSIVLAKIINWGSIEDVQFYIENPKLAKTFRTALKPYNAIKVHGHVVSETQTEVVEEVDEWGEADPMATKVTAPTKRLFIITGAAGDSIDKDTYTEKNITEAIAKIKKAKNAEASFGTDSDSEWGDAKLDDSDDDVAWD